MNDGEIQESKDLKSALGGIFSSIMHEMQGREIEAFKAAASKGEYDNAVECAIKGEVDGFNRHFHLGRTAVLNGLLAMHVPDNGNLRFMFSSNDFVHRHLSEMIRKFEGNACHVDKARRIEREYVRSLMSGSEVNFADATHYSVPKRILLTHDEIDSFVTALRSLYRGDPDRYLKMLVVFAGK